MAYSKEQWARAKFLFELGWTLREIENDCGISNGQIAKRSNREGWEKEAGKQALKSEIVEFEKKSAELGSKKEALIKRVSSLDQFEITILDELVTKEAELKSLVFSAQTLAVVRANQALTKGTKTSLMKVGQYDSKGNRIGETYEAYETDLDASDIRNTVEAIDKASVTLGLSQRHAKTEVNLTAAQQVNTRFVGMRRITEEEKQKARLENGRDITT